MINQDTGVVQVWAVFLEGYGLCLHQCAVRFIELPDRVDAVFGKLDEGHGCLLIQALVHAFTVGEADAVSNVQPGPGNRLVRLVIYLLVLQAAPQAIHKHVLHPATRAVPADPGTRLI